MNDCCPNNCADCDRADTINELQRQLAIMNTRARVDAVSFERDERERMDLKAKCEDAVRSRAYCREQEEIQRVRADTLSRHLAKTRTAFERVNNLLLGTLRDHPEEDNANAARIIVLGTLANLPAHPSEESERFDFEGGIRPSIEAVEGEEIK